MLKRALPHAVSVHDKFDVACLTLNWKDWLWIQVLVCMYAIRHATMLLQLLRG